MTEGQARHAALRSTGAWNLSCTDWQARLRGGQSLIPPLPGLNLIESDRAVGIFNKLRLSDVSGTPTTAESVDDWFRDILRALFGSLDPASKSRMIRELFLLVPKKTGKTTNGALMMLTALLMNQRPRAPFIMTAPVQDVAAKAFDAASGAIDLDPVLKKMLHVRDHVKTIVHRQTQATLEIMTFDPRVLTGQKVAGALIDELHVSSKGAGADKALRQLRGGMLPFPEAFLAFITTQSEDAPSGVFLDELTKAREIRDGKRFGAMLPVLYEFPPEMQQDETAWRDPANWHMVTPALGRQIALPRLVEEFESAEKTSARELRAWASQHLNVQIGVAIQSNGWAGADFWTKDRVTDKTLTFETLLERCEVAVAGVDGGGLDDLLGFAVLGREKGTRRWLLWCHAWAHPIVLERRKSIAPQLLDFEKAGHLTLVKEPGEDVAAVADYVCRIKDAGLLPEKNAIGVDAAGIGDVVDELMSPERGLQDGQIIAISQGWRLNAAIKTAERKLAGGELVHDASPFMCWVVSNARVEPKGNAILITKQASGTAKIDPLMAALDAVALMSLNPEATVGQSFWETAA